MSKDLKVLEEQRAQMKAYLQMKMDMEDWHGVADAAMDLREIDAQLTVIRAMPSSQCDAPSGEHHGN